ncbi:C2 domain containing protein [Tritrichomonas foetus]|uniref:C2 domain containing protein n=1 Tax=Tritrichomonas foetus TaxID=1144522 RepID=A0A1J4JH85_9EUKA|nr:C2 domain containing protein [Tritrichomonas foetus]|eukprot:OHS96628.1 C2 domain containing protein [Tritrichomonas foetus]
MRTFLKIRDSPDEKHLYIDVVEARSLKSCDANGWSDPFVQITLGEKTKIGKTRYIERTLNPRWAQRFHYNGPIDMNHNAYISFVVKDYDTMSSDDVIGIVEIALQDLANHKWCQKWYRLMPENEKVTTRGWLLLRIHLCEKAEDAFAEIFHDHDHDNTHDEEHVHVHGNEQAVPLQTLQAAEAHDEQVEIKDRELAEEKEREEAQKTSGRKSNPTSARNNNSEINQEKLPENSDN